MTHIPRLDFSVVFHFIIRDVLGVLDRSVILISSLSSSAEISSLSTPLSLLYFNSIAWHVERIDSKITVQTLYDTTVYTLSPSLSEDAHRNNQNSNETICTENKHNRGAAMLSV